LIRQYFPSLPLELDEAALFDGCSRWRIVPGVVLVIALQRYLVDGNSITGMAGR
jgi:ABC-type glycerol-3-phosphate transport system permease component